MLVPHIYRFSLAISSARSLGFGLIDHCRLLTANPETFEDKFRVIRIKMGNRCSVSELLSYRTVRMAKLYDRRLGLLHWCTLVLLVVGLFMYQAWWNRGYYASEFSNGHVTWIAKGPVPAVNTRDGANLNLDANDIVSFASQSSLLIATNMFVTAGQRQGACLNPLENCTQDADCRLPDVCVSGFCLSRQWCPAENRTFDGTGYVVGGSTVQYTLSSEYVTMWTRATIDFPTLSPNAQFSTANSMIPVQVPVGIFSRWRTFCRLAGFGTAT